MKKNLLLVILCCILFSFTACLPVSIENESHSSSMLSADGFNIDTSSSESVFETSSLVENSKPTLSEKESSEINEQTSSGKANSSKTPSNNPTASTNSSSQKLDTISTSAVNVKIKDIFETPIEGILCKIGFVPPMTNGVDIPKEYSGYTDSAGNWQFNLFEDDSTRTISSLNIQWNNKFKVTIISLNGTTLEAVATLKDGVFHASVGTMMDVLAEPKPDETITMNLVVEEITE